MNNKIIENEFHLRDELSQDFYNGIKSPSSFRVGAEIERINVLKNTYEAVPYVIIGQFLDVFASRYDWSKVKNGAHTVGLQKDGSNISLEPGSQVELGIAPSKNIHNICEYLNGFNKKYSEISDCLGFHSLGYGIQPQTTFERINIIPKARYEMMSDYFLDKGNMAYVMMRETAGTQVALDYSSEGDAVLKLRLGMFLAPIVSAMFANSPVRGGQNTGYQSFRAKSWLYTDEQRCGFISEKLFDLNYEFGFGNYVDALLDVPMIYVSRENKNYQVNKTFREYIKDGYDGLEATLDDWRLHANLFFPEVRLRGFIELRNADAQRSDMSLALLALYKGLFYDDEALSQVVNLFDGVTFEDLKRLRYMTPMYALGVEIKGGKVLDFAKELVVIAKNSLVRQACQNQFAQDESVYLQVLEGLLAEGKTPADRVLEFCGSDVASIVEYCSY